MSQSGATPSYFDCLKRILVRPRLVSCSNRISVWRSNYNTAPVFRSTPSGAWKSRGDRFGYAQRPGVLHGAQISFDSALDTAPSNCRLGSARRPGLLRGAQISFDSPLDADPTR